MPTYNPKLLNRHVFLFNPEDNGDSSVTLMTENYADGEGGSFTIQEFSLQSCANSASIHLGTEITPRQLRRLADELEKVRNEAIDMAQAIVDKTH